MSKFKMNDMVEIKKIRGPSLLSAGMIGRVDGVRWAGPEWRKNMGTGKIVDVFFDLYPTPFSMCEKELKHAN